MFRVTEESEIFNSHEVMDKRVSEITEERQRGSGSLKKVKLRLLFKSHRAKTMVFAKVKVISTERDKVRHRGIGDESRARAL